MGHPRVLEGLGFAGLSRFGWDKVLKAFDGASPRLFRPRYALANLGHPSCPFFIGLGVWLFALAYVFVPGFQVFFDFGHEAAGVGSVDDAMIEAQG